jgi:hypothetical protein
MSRQVSNNKHASMASKIAQYKEANCHVCAKSGESAQVVRSHNFRDPKGRIVCSRFIEKKKNHECRRCFEKGHFEQECTPETRLASENKHNRFTRYCSTIGQNQQESRKVVPKQPISTSNSFAGLVADESSDEDEELLVQKAKTKTNPKVSATASTAPVQVRSLLDSDVPHPNITVRKGRCWADLSDDEEDTPAANVTVREKKSWASIAAVHPVPFSVALSDEKSVALLSFLKKQHKSAGASRWSEMDNMPLRRGGRSPSPCCDEDF